MEGADLQAFHSLGQKAGGLENKIIGFASRLRRRRAADLQDQRRARKKTQAQLAQEVGIQRSRISEYENGRHYPGAFIRRKIKEVLG